MPRLTRAAIDAETFGIESRPKYPPRAVGYAIRAKGRSKYLAFGHPTNNNCSRAEALREVRSVLRESRPVFHNADFDIEVMARDNIAVRGPYDDTLKLAFLNNPRARSLSLKPTADALLGMPPVEQDLLKEWILANVKEAKKRPSTWGAYIAYAPGDLVGMYAKGDVDRTLALYKHFNKEVLQCGMKPAYEREMALVPIKLKMEQGGVKVRLHKLKKDLPAFERVRIKARKEIQRRLGLKTLNVDSNKQLAEALLARDLLDPVIMTAPSKTYPDGQVSTRREVLESNCGDPKLVQALSVYGVLNTYINTFLIRWIERGEMNDSYVQPTFNTVRSSDEYGSKGGFGTRTGRLSSSDPNLQNVPKNISESAQRSTLMMIGRLLAKEGVNFIGLRDYFQPDEGCVFLRRDYSQQELRILADACGGAFLDMYLEDPMMDAHDAVRRLVLEATGLNYPRSYIKNTNFGILYGMGLKRLAQRLGITIKEARLLRKAVGRAIPGVRMLQDRFEGLAAKDQPFHTWGGREYFCEEPKYVDLPQGGVERWSFEYKMLNTYIQGSAADCTKDGMINVDANMHAGRMVLQVHDEIVLSVPRQHAKREMLYMKEAMEDVQFKIPMLTDGEIGRRSWGHMVDEHRARL